MAARDYWGHGLRSALARRGFNAVLIERDRSECCGDPLQPLHDALEAGDSLILFPEGTRNAGMLPQQFKSGLFHLAQRHPHAEFIPVYLNNTRRCLPKGSALPVPLICTVRFGKALSLGAKEDKPSFLQRAHDAVVALA